MDSPKNRIAARVTIKDVAQAAKVSLSTVSRALREPGNTPPETVGKVMAAAKALNYVYNATAGSLSSSRTGTIGVLLPSPAFAAFGVNLVAIQEVCAESGISCRVALSQFSPELERLALRRFHEQRIDGLILVGLDKSNVEAVLELERSGIPSIVLWDAVDERLNSIAVDNFAAVSAGIRYFIELGHRRVGLMLGPFACAQRNVDRLAGYKKTLEDHAIAFDEDMVHSHLPTLLNGKESMRTFLRLADPPSAVLCVNDYLAIGAVRAINDAGLRVPEDMSVCGFDDIEISAYFTPPLTTIRTPCYEMGRMAARMLIEAVTRRKPLYVQYLLDTEIIVRKTCARFRCGAPPRP